MALEQFWWFQALWNISNQSSIWNKNLDVGRKFDPQISFAFAELMGLTAQVISAYKIEEYVKASVKLLAEIVDMRPIISKISPFHLL